MTPGYDANGWLINLNTQSGSTVTTLASNIAYSGLAGAAGKITTMDYGSGDIYTASYDTGMRLTSATLTEASNNAVLYSTQPAYDAANNVVSVQTSIAGQTDTQQFCYDSLNRLTWAGSSGTPPCASLTPGTLTGAQYQQSDSYNTINGLTSGPAGSYTYGSSSHPHAVTSTSSGYSATYDATGNLICRAPTSATTCSGSSPTGQQLSYDPTGRLTSWQNQPNSPTSTANYLYDGSGNRVAMLSTVNGTSTLTAYLGSIEEVQKTGSTTTTTTYYAVDGMRIAAKINGTFDYFGYDALGSQVVVLNNSGALIGSQLYGPYGNPRYSSGTLPTSISFTGQQADSVTGLDYFNARYYDPVTGQFLSADMVQGNAQGTSPYAYVMGNPESRTDPTGQRYTCGPDNSGCSGGSGSSGGGGGGEPGGGGKRPNPGGATDLGNCQENPAACQESPAAPTKTTQPGGSSTNKNNKGKNPPKEKSPTCTFLGCVQNWGEFVGGVAMVLTGIGILVLAIAAYFNVAGGLLGFLETLARGALEKASSAVLGLIHAGMALIRSSMYSYANRRILNLVLDGINIISDLATLAFSGLDALKQLGDGRAKGILSEVGILFRGFQNAQANGIVNSVYIPKTEGLGGDLANMGGSLVFLGFDIYQFYVDWNS